MCAGNVDAYNIVCCCNVLIFAMTEAAGMEVWVDNWGLAGAPGDRSQFLCHHPGNNIIYSNGEISLFKGDSLFIPAIDADYKIIGQCELIASKVN